MAVITVLRVPASLGGSARKYKLLIDSVERGRLAGGDEIEVEVRQGSHTVQARIDWTGSNVVEVTLDETETASFAVEPAAETQIAQLKTIFGRRGYLKLRRITE